jgi:ArsR family transcriptional regulator
MSGPTSTRPDTDLVQRFHAVAEETRLSIVRLLSGGERCVCELQEELGAAQSRLSFHLKKLRDAGLVEDRRDGRWVYYRLVPEALDEMRKALGQLTPRDPVPWSSGDDGCCR